MVFLSAPLKTTNEIDLYKPLKTYVDSLSELSEDLRQEANEGLTELNKLRNRACCQLLDKHQSSLDVLTRYYDQLEAMVAKLPITPTQNPVSFKWKDAFDKGSLFFSRASLTLNDSSFERACVLFNCGALMSSIAANQQLNTDEELKTMARLFQQAAGIFSKLKDTVLGLVQQEPTPDLMPDTLIALSMLMVAQAQEAIYIKAAKDKIKPGSLLRITAQCADFYNDTQKLMAKENIRGIWEKDWIPTVTGKGFAFGALAQFHASEMAGNEQSYGEQIARLKEAQRLMDQSNSYIPNAFPEQVAMINKTSERATKDNNFIYHARVPDFKTLPLLNKAALAKPSAIIHPLSPRFKDLFESLVPVSVQHALSTFETKKNEVVNVDVSRMREYTQLMNACLASMNLPAALDDVTKQEQCPESIREKSSKVKANGGINDMKSKINELPALHKRNEEILNETSRLLKDEKENDDCLRGQFGGKWTRVSSENLTAPLIQELGKYRGILLTAGNADSIVRNKFEQYKRGMELLSMTENDLKASIPSIGCRQGSASSSLTINKLRELMNQVQEIKVDRENVEKELKKIRFDMSNEFSRALAETGVVNEEKLSAEKIQQLFKPLRDRVENSIKRQETIIAEVEQWNKRFAEERHVAGGAEREKLLKELATSYDSFFELQANLNEGTKFYNDLTPILVRLQQKVSDFCFARQTEKDDLMKQVQQNIVSGGSSQSKTAPPPRPPPPAVPASAPPPPQHQNAYQYQAAPAPQMPSMPINQPPQHYQQQQQPGHPYQQQMYQQQQQPNPYMPYAAPFPYGQNPYGGQQQHQGGYQQQQTPYPMNYPGTYPGAYPQQQYVAYPPPPQPPNPGNTNPFQ